MEIISNLLVHILRQSDYPLFEIFPLLAYFYHSCNSFVIPTNTLIVLRDSVDHVWMEIEMHSSEMNVLAMQLVDSVENVLKTYMML